MRGAADALDDPDHHLGRQIELAGDELSGEQLAEVVRQVSDLPTRFEQQDLDRLRRFSDENASVFAWFNTDGFQTDIPALRSQHPELTTLETWAAAPEPPR